MAVPTLRDPFARATAKQANVHATDAASVANRALEIALHVRKQQAEQRLPMFVGKCALCGAPCKQSKRYCLGHGWAE